MVQTETSSPNQCSVESTGPSKQRYDWETLAASSSYIRRTSWELRALPQELDAIPDDITVPKQLRQLLNWSLVPGRDWSYQPPPKPAARSRTHSQSSKHSDTQKIVPSLPEIDDDANQSVGSIVSASTASYKSSVSQFGSVVRGHSPDGDKSLKNKLLAKIRLGKSDGRFLFSDSKESFKLVKAVVATAECTSCFEDLAETEMTRLKSCRHWYCKECLSTLIVTAMAAEASFPPKCCLSPIPLQQILKALSGQQREMYQNKAAEYAVPTTDRWYCPNKDCLRWIPRGKLKINRDLGYDCPHCSAKLCRTCRGPAHPTNSECPQDFGLEATLETAEIEGWQRCYKCRALVEHNKGCRHMTCRCKAEFCYVCGLRWQTCACTETDAANKRTRIQQRRQERTAQVDAEAEEIARAIAEVEEMERLEAEQRLLEEERLQREEDEQLRLLEAERQAEEARRQEEAEQAERNFRRVLISSFEEELVQMHEILHQILRYQFEAITARHAAEDARLGSMHLEDEAQAEQDLEANNQKVSGNSAKRTTRLSQKHKEETESLEARQEEEEDDLFLQLQMRFKGKANRESRMERMMSEIRGKQEEEQKELRAKQNTEMKNLDQKIALDLEGVKKWYQYMIDETRRVQTMALQKFGFVVGADRQYFEIVAERRITMLTQHGINSVASLEMGQEPIGLTEYEASRIEPCLPEYDDGEQGPSGIRRGSGTATTPHDALQTSPSSHSPRRETTSTSQAQSPPIPILRLQTDDIDDEQNTTIQRQPSRPPVPGAFPVDLISALPEPTQQVPNTISLSWTEPPPPPQPRTLPPPPPIPRSLTPIPRSLTPTPSLIVPPLMIRKPVTSSPTESVSTSPRLQRPAPSQPQAQHQQSTSGNAIPAITMASLAAGMAMATVPQQVKSIAPRNPKAPATSVAEIDLPDVNQDRRTSNASSSSAVTAKKSKWNFMRPKDAQEITEEEMKKKLRAAVGDAF